MAGDDQTGVMVMRMEEGLDTGPVLMAERVAITRQTAGELTGALSRLGADLMARALGALERDQVQQTAQPEDGVTYAKKILKDEARIDWTKSAREIDCHIRGLSPWPGAWTGAGGERLKVLYAEPAAGNGAPGTVIGENLTIACGDGALRLTRVQRAGGKAMDAADLLKGFAVPRGTLLV
jgi:methionyl-tRNA formyltransferase